MFVCCGNGFSNFSLKNRSITCFVSLIPAAIGIIIYFGLIHKLDSQIRIAVLGGGAGIATGMMILNIALISCKPQSQLQEHLKGRDNQVGIERTTLTTPHSPVTTTLPVGSPPPYHTPSPESSWVLLTPRTAVPRSCFSSSHLPNQSKTIAFLGKLPHSPKTPKQQAGSCSPDNTALRRPDETPKSHKLRLGLTVGEASRKGKLQNLKNALSAVSSPFPKDLLKNAVRNAIQKDNFAVVDQLLLNSPELIEDAFDYSISEGKSSVLFFLHQKVTIEAAQLQSYRDRAVIAFATKNEKETWNWVTVTLVLGPVSSTSLRAALEIAEEAKNSIASTIKLQLEERLKVEEQEKNNQLPDTGHSELLPDPRLNPELAYFDGQGTKECEYQ